MDIPPVSAVGRPSSRVMVSAGYELFRHPHLCLQKLPAITQLSARIQELEERGYVSETKPEHGDFVYNVVSKHAVTQLSLI